MDTRIKYSVMLAFAALSVASCKIYDDSEVLQEPAYMVVCSTYEDCISEIFKVAELADFFSLYQDIRSDREAAMELAESYFPYWINEDNLYYEEADVSGWGRIVLEEDGSFSVFTDHGFWGDRYLQGTGEFRYVVTETGERSFSVELSGTDTGLDLSISAVVTCDDDWVTVESCSVSYMPSSTGGYTVSSVEGAPVKKVTIASGQDVYQASSGSLAYSYCLDGTVTDDFTLSFGDQYVAILRDGRVAKCRPLQSYGGWSADYVIEIE
ncbi:MAG: hypothetical protein IAC29_01810 [Bacteroidetes bacterium]|uniref:Uncharacterized protein n=1 Tax=Candidatus Cryptobacteroides merdigallinarum TaxID=2840770 RepID=A0A9D9HFJ9_9BACT|nr:hypothetical protein [Candidatus Cryptobacteroides merdigallinarum]